MTLVQAYQVMGILDPPNLTKAILRSKYRELVIQVHPDRGGNPYLFDLVKQAYTVISQSRRDWNGGTEQVSASMQQLSVDRTEKEREWRPRAPAAASAAAASAASSSRVALHPQRFDVQQFNAVFNDNYKGSEEEQRDHLSFMKRQDRVVRDIQVWEEPDPLSYHNYATLDASTASFTSKAYTDLYEAYTERHPDEIKGRNEVYHSIEDVKSNRAQHIQMTQADREKEHRLQQWRQAQEAQRQQRVNTRDHAIDTQHQLLTQRLTVLGRSDR